MLKLKVTYILNENGLNDFQDWYAEVLEITSVQDGFRDMYFEKDVNKIIVYLHFENQEKLDLWTSTPIHDELASRIERNILKPVIVEVL